MKTLSKLKLNQFSKAELDQRALNAIKGGCSCTCSCSCSCSCAMDGLKSSLGGSDSGIPGGSNATLGGASAAY